jgi:hypothetical protein
MLPTTTIGFCINLTSDYQFTMDAIAIEQSPAKEKLNITGINLREAGGALTNLSK